MRRLSIPEVLESLEDKSSEEKVEILKQNDTKSLRQILYIAFTSNCEFLLPNSRPESLKIKEVPKGLARNSLYQQTRKLKIFMKNTGYDHLSQSKRENLFFQILESIDNSESELLLQLCVDRKLKTSLTYQEVFEAFENLLPKKEPEPVVEEVSEEKQSYKNLQELYEEKVPKKSKSKKSSKKKSK